MILFNSNTPNNTYTSILEMDNANLTWIGKPKYHLCLFPDETFVNKNRHVCRKRYLFDEHHDFWCQFAILLILETPDNTCKHSFNVLDNEFTWTGKNTTYAFSPRNNWQTQKHAPFVGERSTAVRSMTFGHDLWMCLVWEHQVMHITNIVNIIKVKSKWIGNPKYHLCLLPAEQFSNNWHIYIPIYIYKVFCPTLCLYLSIYLSISL